MIDEQTIQKIKDAASIVDVIGDFYDLRKRGVEYECRCPFHEDRHLGSFKVSPRKNYAKCFSCGWQGGPIDFLIDHEHLNFVDAIRWLGKKYSIEVEGSDTFNVPAAKPRREQPTLPMLVLPASMVAHTESSRDTDQLVTWLSSLKWDAAQRHRISESLKAYHIGHSKQGLTVFWQIDEQQRVRTGKMMLYKADGHRDKETKYNFDWIHSALYRDYRTGYSADKTDVKPCLFGLHLLDTYRRQNVCQDVCIVESEKTALIMSIAYGNSSKQVWMACGGLGNINRDRLKPLMEQHRHIILYPDRDGVEAWKAKADTLHYDRVTVDARPVTEWWRKGDPVKADIADIIVRMVGESKTYTTIEEVIKDMPQIQRLTKELDLTIQTER